MSEVKKNTRFTRTKSEDISIMTYSKIPPQARELEQAVLGACLIERSAYPQIMTFMSKDIFYVDAHSNIYDAMEKLFIKNEPIDLLSVTEKLRNMEKLEETGGAYYLSELTNSIAPSSNVEYHAKIIFQKYMARQVITNCNELTRDAYEDCTDPFDLVSRAQVMFSHIIDRIRKNSVRSLASIAKETIIAMRESAENPKELIGLETPLPLLNDQTDGWQAPDLIIIAAGTSEGKSTFMLQCAEFSANKGEPTAIFSMEMSFRQLCWKVFAPAVGAPVKDIRKGKLTNEQWDKLDKLYTNIIANDNLYISEEGGMDISDFRAIARGLVTDKGVTSIYVDYLQLFVARKGDLRFLNREAEVNYISKQLKATAKELNIPVIALSQLSRIKEKRFYILSDLRESGAIEQDADTVIFLWRPAYHQVEQTKDGIRYAFDDTEIIIAKYRLGEPGKILAKFDGKLSRFRDHTFMAYVEATEEEKNIISGKKIEKEPILEEDPDLPF